MSWPTRKMTKQEWHDWVKYPESVDYWTMWLLMQKQYHFPSATVAERWKVHVSKGNPA